MSKSLAAEAQDAVNLPECAHSVAPTPEDTGRVGTVLCYISVPALHLVPRLPGSASSSCPQDLLRGGGSLGRS